MTHDAAETVPATGTGAQRETRPGSYGDIARSAAERLAAITATAAVLGALTGSWGCAATAGAATTTIVARDTARAIRCRRRRLGG